MSFIMQVDRKKKVDSLSIKLRTFKFFVVTIKYLLVINLSHCQLGLNTKADF